MQPRGTVSTFFGRSKKRDAQVYMASIGAASSKQKQHRFLHTIMHVLYCSVSFLTSLVHAILLAHNIIDMFSDLIENLVIEVS